MRSEGSRVGSVGRAVPRRGENHSGRKERAQHGGFSFVRWVGVGGVRVSLWESFVLDWVYDLSVSVGRK